MPNWKKLITSGPSASLTSLTLTSLSGQGSEATSVMINSGGVLGTRELGSLAFSSATYDNYSSWNLKTDNVQRTTVGSGGTLDIVGGTEIGVSYGAGGVVTINNSITNNNQLTNGEGYTTYTSDQATDTTSLPQFQSIKLAGVANPEISFNGSSDAGVDMAIKATPEGLDFYEPEDTNKIHFQILDDTGVNATYGLQINGTSVLTSTRVLENVSGNISQFTNNSNYLTLANNADNRIVTATGTSSPNAEANLTYDGNTLYVYGATAGDTVLDIQGTQGQLFSITDDLTGDLFSVADISGTPVLAVSASGLVEIDDTLKVVTSLGVGTDPTTTVGEIRATNDITAYYSSDERLKDNITPITNSLDKLKEIKGVSFDWVPKEGIHSHEGHDVGVIAQDIEKVLPEIVENRENGYKAVRYEKLVALLIETNKELLKRVEELEKKL